jgi:hypothetical protein
MRGNFHRNSDTTVLLCCCSLIIIIAMNEQIGGYMLPWCQQRLHRFHPTLNAIAMAIAF